MTTLGIKLNRTGDPDSVCHHSGLTRQDCDYLCHNCGQAFVPCPSRAEIYKRAEELRQTWPTSRLDKQEQREWDMEIPEATRVWDHMKRKQDGGQQR